jgi:hypothetical protein
MKWRHAHDLAKVGGEACTGHGRPLSWLFQRPRGFRVFVHALDRLAQTFICDPQQDATVNQALIHGGPYKKHKDVFEETIENWLPAREFGGSFRE